MGRIPEHIIEQVREAHAIEEIVGRTVELKRAGASFKALCPFHEEKTPSFTVNPNRQTYKCFGCGKGGNVFTFLMETMGITFPEAVRMLADERGIQVPRTAGGSDDKERDHRRALYEALTMADRFFRHSLTTPEGTEARAYLNQRGYDDEAIERFGLGYAPPGWDRLLQAASRRVKPEVLLAAGLVQERRERGGHYDRFRNRVMFPIADLRGRVVTFGARALSSEDNPKYLNGPETDVFHKSSVLYALDRAQQSIRKRGEALLMEGYTDVLMAHMNGFDHAVAGMGTALTDRQAATLRRFASRVVLVYDSDAAGQAASERGIDILIKTGLEVRIAQLPEGRDVDEILLEEGPEAFQAVLDAAVELFAFKLRALAGRHDLGTPRGRAEAIESLVPTLAIVPSEIERDQLFRMIAERLGGPETEVALRRAVAQKLGRPMPGMTRPPAAEAARPRSAAERTFDDSQEKAEMVVLLGALDERFRDAVLRSVGPEDFQHPVLQRLYALVVELEEQGIDTDLDRLVTRTADDAEAAATLASLDLEGDLEEALEAHLRSLERRRRRARHRGDLKALAAQFGADPSPASGRRPPGKKPRSPEPNEQWPADVSGTPDPSGNPEPLGAVEDPAPPELEAPPYDEAPRDE
ncbi:MAG: DNA primase [Planctomycetota bacterium]|nr:DNA primase [Planctomycetota bacterium]